MSEDCVLNIQCYFSVLFAKRSKILIITFFMIICSKNDALECMKSFSGLLRSGGALIIDHRNFHPMIHKGKVNKNGFNPCTLVSLAWACSLICFWTEHTRLLTVIPNCLVEYILISEAELLLHIEMEKSWPFSTRVSLLATILLNRGYMLRSFNKSIMNNSCTTVVLTKLLHFIRMFCRVIFSILCKITPIINILTQFCVFVGEI